MRTTSCLVAALVAAGSGSALADIVIDGGASWSGWSSVASSQTSGVWINGATNRTYDIYRTSFTLSATQGVSGTRLADGAPGDGSGYTGDNAASLTSGSWQVGDRIIGMGIAYTGSTRGATWFFHTDRNGDSKSAASSFGASDGVSTSNAGDTSSYISNVFFPRGQVSQYSIFTSFSSDGTNNFIFPYGQLPSLAMPVRSFSILEAGSAVRSQSMQFFINVDAVLRSNGGATYGEGTIAPPDRIGFWEGDNTAGWNGTQFTQQIFEIPAPSGLAMVGLAVAVAARRRRR
jgi:hypothetical protein